MEAGESGETGEPASVELNLLPLPWKEGELVMVGEADDDDDDEKC